MPPGRMNLPSMERVGNGICERESKAASLSALNISDSSERSGVQATAVAKSTERHKKFEVRATTEPIRRGLMKIVIYDLKPSDFTPASTSEWPPVWPIQGHTLLNEALSGREMQQWSKRR